MPAFELKPNHDKLCCICQHFEEDFENGRIYGICQHAEKKRGIAAKNVKKYDNICDED